MKSRIVTGIALGLACLLVAALLWFKKGAAFHWEGRWVCDAIINPAGERIPLSALPPVYTTLSSEEACGYNRVTAVAPTAAFILRADRRGEMRLGPPLQALAWRRSDAGAELDFDDHSNQARLRPVRDGVEATLTGYAWRLLFKREESGSLPAVRFLDPNRSQQVVQAQGRDLVLDRERGAPMDTGKIIGPYVPFLNLWKPGDAKVLRTGEGMFLDLGENGTLRVAGPGEDPAVYEGLNLDLAETAKEGTACGRCNERSRCHSVRIEDGTVIIL